MISRHTNYRCSCVTYAYCLYYRTRTPGSYSGRLAGRYRAGPQVADRGSSLRGVAVKFTAPDQPAAILEVGAVGSRLATWFPIKCCKCPLTVSCHIASETGYKVLAPEERRLDSSCVSAGICRHDIFLQNCCLVVSTWLCKG